MSALLIPVVTFGRVFDTTPSREVLTLPELVASLHRFELKPQTLAAIEREQARVDAARESWRAGAPPRGKVAGKLYKAADGAADPGAAVEAKAAAMREDARRSAKRDLRLWSPAVYRPGATERGTENVTHVGCLVLDYDDGTPPEEASLLWEGYFHIVHSTWSHTDLHPKFRLVLPLAFPVAARDWAAMWGWAERRAHFSIDPSMKSPAANYALPAVPHPEWPRTAFSEPGVLLDAVEEGIVARRVSLSLRRHGPLDGSPSVMRGQDPEKGYLDHDEELAGVLADPPPGALPSEERPSTPSPPSSRSPADATGEGSPGGDAEGHPLVGALERLASLHERGALDDAELARAKALLLSEPAPEDAALRRVGRRHRRSLCIDFDGVLHAYTSGWKGATVIPDPPVAGALAFLEEAAEQFELAIFSSRSHLPGGVVAMRAWLSRQGLAQEVLERLRFPLHKPPAEIYLDNRALRFEGTFPRLAELTDLAPWWEPSR